MDPESKLLFNRLRMRERDTYNSIMLVRDANEAGIDPVK